MSNDHWEVIAKMFNCPECGWVTTHYDHCKLGEKKEPSMLDIIAGRLESMNTSWDVPL